MIKKIDFKLLKECLPKALFKTAFNWLSFVTFFVFIFGIIYFIFKFPFITLPILLICDWGYQVHKMYSHKKHLEKMALESNQEPFTPIQSYDNTELLRKLSRLSRPY